MSRVLRLLLIALLLVGPVVGPVAAAPPAPASCSDVQNAINALASAVNDCIIHYGPEAADVCSDAVADIRHALFEELAYCMDAPVPQSQASVPWRQTSRATF